MKTITRKEIKKKLAKHYGGNIKTNMELRELYEHKNKDDHGKLGSIFFSLTGSPPKGYAIVIPDLRKISLYDLTGKRFRILKETVLEKEDSE